jgi:hypothetical protein
MDNPAPTPALESLMVSASSEQCNKKQQYPRGTSSMGIMSMSMTMTMGTWCTTHDDDGGPMFDGMEEDGSRRCMMGSGMVETMRTTGWVVLWGWQGQNGQQHLSRVSGFIFV